ncbi:MAG TPA: ornithine--oxo-acid transaminase [Gammaproteobacteria bacterium]|nr:ornithine--oxo-acid transaminase [Gammaproteobacteria bacterium]
MVNTIETENKFCAHNYHPLPVVLVRGQGVFVWDDQDKRYFDMMSAYSAVSHGHLNPRLVNALQAQLNQLAVVSRAFYTDKLAPFLQKACEITGQDKALPMNTGAEAVETAIKAARKWAYERKGVEADKAEIITCHGNFHGRTISIVAFSTEAQYKAGFGPFPEGFKHIPYADSEALEQAINKNTAAFLVEPIQGEGGIIVPPEGYLRQCAKICRENNVLLICDEIQTGLGRTGKLLASEHDAIVPDGLILGKALGGGLLPVSLFLSRKDVMDVFRPGDHGSTFGGNPLASAVGLEALNLIIEESFPQTAEQLGNYFMRELTRLNNPLIKEIRGKGLLIGVEIEKKHATARQVCEVLMKNGLLTKETHETVVRFAPPLVITRKELDEAITIIKSSLESLSSKLK